MTAPDARQTELWRIGTSWGIHVYQGEKGSPDERPVATFHVPADAQRAVNAVNGRADAHQSDELREVLEQHAIPGGYRDLDRDELAAAILPVVTAWAEQRARARAAEELRKAANEIEPDSDGGFTAALRFIYAADGLRARAAALTADDRTDAR